MIRGKSVACLFFSWDTFIVTGITGKLLVTPDWQIQSCLSKCHRTKSNIIPDVSLREVLYSEVCFSFLPLMYLSPLSLIVHILFFFFFDLKTQENFFISIAVVRDFSKATNFDSFGLSKWCMNLYDCELSCS